MAWSNSYSVTIDHTKVPNTDQADFPVLFKGIFPALKTTGNGGQVTSTSGFDIIFASDSAGASPLTFRRVSWDASTGACQFWVKIPTLSHTADTVIYILFGNSAITTDQQSVAGVWSNGYVTRNHLQTDSTDDLGAFNGTDTGVTHSSSGGQIGGATSFNGSSSVSLGTSASLQPASFSFSAWVNPASLNGYTAIFSSDAASSNDGITLLVKSNNKLALYLVIANNNYIAYDGSGSQSVPLGSWTHFYATYDGSTKQLKGYLNGVLDGSVTGAGSTFTPTTSRPMLVGNSAIGGRAWNGNIEEIGIANVVRSADWIATEFSNQANPYTFYSTSLTNTDMYAASLVAHAGAAGSGPASTATTAAINTTGADLIVGYVVGDLGGTQVFSDSAANTWTPLTNHPANNNPNVGRLFYCLNPTTSASHTFSFNGNYPVLFVQAWNSAGAHLANDSGQSGSGGAIAASPALSEPVNWIAISGVGEGTAGATFSVDSLFTISDQRAEVNAVNYGGGLAYRVGSSAAAVNPTWTPSAGGPLSTALAVFTTTPTQAKTTQIGITAIVPSPTAKAYVTQIGFTAIVPSSIIATQQPIMQVIT